MGQTEVRVAQLTMDKWMAFARWLGQSLRSRYVRELERQVARLERENREWRDALFAVRGIPLPEELRPPVSSVPGVMRRGPMSPSQRMREMERRDAEAAAKEMERASA